MTTTQRALIGLLMATGTGGAAGGYLYSDQAMAIIRDACAPSPERMEQVIGGQAGKRVQVTINTSLSWLGRLCDPNSTGLGDRVEVTVMPGAGK